MASALGVSGWPSDEAERLATLIDLFLRLPAPPGRSLPFTEFGRLRDRLGHAVEEDGPEEIEPRFLELYAHLHMNEALYSIDERRQMDATGGYWNHAGGLSPILKAAPWIGEETVSADFGAGNGLQGLLLQALYPHARTVQIEISARMKDIGEALGEWLGVPRHRVEWVIDDVLTVPAAGYDFIYLYRPVRPEGPGREFYTRFAREVESEPRPPRHLLDRRLPAGLPLRPLRGLLRRRPPHLLQGRGRAPTRGALRAREGARITRVSRVLMERLR